MLHQHFDHSSATYGDILGLHVFLLQEVGDVEQDYSNSIQKLLRSSSYSFHSNILMKWLGSDPYKEIG